MFGARLFLKLKWTGYETIFQTCVSSVLLKGYLQNETISRQQHELKQNDDIIMARTAMYLNGKSCAEIGLTMEFTSRFGIGFKVARIFSALVFQICMLV